MAYYIIGSPTNDVSIIYKRINKNTIENEALSGSWLVASGNEGFDTVIHFSRPS